MLRRLALITALFFATAAHAAGSLTIDLDRSGQFYVDHEKVGVPIGTPVDACTDDLFHGTCVFMADATHGVLGGLTAPHDPDGKTLPVHVTVQVVGGVVVNETIDVHDFSEHDRDMLGPKRLQIDLHPDRSATVRAL